MRKANYKKKSIKKMVKEPVVSGYKNRTIQIFNSFEEANEYEIDAILKQSPVQRIKDTVNLILRMYGFSRAELKKRVPGKNIKVIQYE